MFRRFLPSYVSNLRGDYHNPLPAKLVHTWKINLRRLVIFAGKFAGSSVITMWTVPCDSYRWDSLYQRVSIAALAGKAVTHKISCG